MSTAQAPASAAGLPGTEPGGEPDAVIHTEDLTKVYPGTDFAAVDQLNLDVRAGEIFGLLGPNGAGKTTTAGMLTTRVVPTSGRAFLAGIDVAAHPALAKQLSGIVSQQNTLDRQLTVWENLYFHGRLFGMGAKASRQIATDLLEQFQLSQVGQGVGVRAVRRHGPAAHGGAGHLPPPVGAVPRRADRGPGPAEQARAVGPARRAARRGPDDPAHHALHGGGRPALRAGRDHGPRPDPGARYAGRAQAEHRRRHHRHRADHRRPGRLAELLAADVEGVTRTRVADDRLELHVQGGDRLVPRIVLSAERGGFELVDVSIAEPSLETVFINLTGKELRD